MHKQWVIFFHPQTAVTNTDGQLNQIQIVKQFKAQNTQLLITSSTLSFESSKRSFCDIDSPSIISQGNSIK